MIKMCDRVLKNELDDLVKLYSEQLNKRINSRISEMEKDDQSHFLMYNVLGISSEEGKIIDIYQNKGRFLYRYAGSFLEEATKLCFKHKFPHSGTVRIQNTMGNKPKTFEIDCLIDKKAIEIKWRDATTDGDHINKERTRIKVISAAGLKPIRIMFYYPNRKQSKKVQKSLAIFYKDIGGEYYCGNDAWEYVKEESGINLKKYFEEVVFL